MDAYDNLGNDTGLAEGAEEEGEGSGDDDDEADLHDGQGQRRVQRVLPLPRPVRGRLHRRRARMAHVRRRHPSLLTERHS